MKVEKRGSERVVTMSASEARHIVGLLTHGMAFVQGNEEADMKPMEALMGGSPEHGHAAVASTLAMVDVSSTKEASTLKKEEFGNRMRKAMGEAARFADGILRLDPLIEEVAHDEGSSVEQMFEDVAKGLREELDAGEDWKW